MQQMFTISEVASSLKVCEETIYREVKDQRLTGTKIRGQWRFTQDSIDEYLASRTMKANKKKALVRA